MDESLEIRAPRATIQQWKAAADAAGLKLTEWVKLRCTDPEGAAEADGKTYPQRNVKFRNLGGLA